MYNTDKVNFLESMILNLSTNLEIKVKSSKNFNPFVWIAIIPQNRMNYGWTTFQPNFSLILMKIYSEPVPN